MDLTHMRSSYERSELRENQICSNAIDQLRRWLQDALAAEIVESNAMCLCTARDGAPSARIVLLRRLDDRGLVFFTSYFSRKGREIHENPQAAAVFYWAPLERQVRVEGTAEELPQEESDAYFASRPRGHQLSAWASEQSEPVDCRDLLDQRMADYALRFEGEAVPRPHSWGGYLLRPQRMEFWQGRPNRMHDRIEYALRHGAWSRQRLQP